MSKQIIGMDLSTSKDCSCISSICSNCKHVIETKLYNPEVHGCDLTIYDACPYCGVKLTKHIINE